MKNVLTIAAVLACVVAARPARAVDPTGNWRAEIPCGNQPIEARFWLRYDSEGPTLTGQYIDEFSDRFCPITNAHFANNQLTFTVARNIDGKMLTTRYEGMLRGDKIFGKFTAQLGEFRATSDLTAKRQVRVLFSSSRK
jgi:hypothetical protein